jgi:hypothetical protein
MNVRSARQHGDLRQVLAGQVELFEELIEDVVRDVLAESGYAPPRRPRSRERRPTGTAGRGRYA